MNEYLQLTEQKSQATIKNLEDKLATIIATGANPALLNGIQVEYYEVMTPLNQVASIKAPDASMLIVSPFDRAITKDIVEAVSKANLGLNPVDEGDSIRIMVPAITSEKRELFAKDAKAIGEESKISIRNIRQDSNKKIRNDAALSENEIKLAEEEVQKIVDINNKKIDEIVKEKITKLLAV